MRGTSCVVAPSPAHAFLEQPVLEGEIGPHLLERAGLTAQVLHLIGRGGPGRVARQAARAGFQELLGPAVVRRGGNALAPARAAARLASPRRPSSTMRIFWAETWRRVTRRMSFSVASAEGFVFVGPDVCFTVAPGSLR